MNRSLAFTLLLLAPLAAGAAMYRWVDEQGRVHYTQTPPPGMKAESVRKAPPPGANPGMDAVRSFNQSTDKAAEAEAKKKAEDQKKQAGRKERCDTARNNLQIMETRAPNRIAVENPDGSSGRMTPEQYEKQLAEMRAIVAKDCDKSAAGDAPAATRPADGSGSGY